MSGSVVRDVILRDGSTVRLRSPQPADESELKAFFEGLDAESRYLRFHGIGGWMGVVAREYAQADGQARVALIARHGAGIVAVAGYDQLRDPAAAEVGSLSWRRFSAGGWVCGCSSSSPSTPRRRGWSALRPT